MRRGTLIFPALIAFIIARANAAPTIEYSEPIGDRYAKLTVINGNQVVRKLHGDQHEQGAFEKVTPNFFSSDSKYLIFTQVTSGEVELPDEPPRYHEVTYCGIINTQSGCLITKDTGAFCGGSFTTDGKWRTPFYPDFDLEKMAPKVESYLEEHSLFDNAPLSSLENLMKCDPPSNATVENYKYLLEQKAFDPNDPNLKKLTSILAQQ